MTLRTSNLILHPGVVPHEPPAPPGVLVFKEPAYDSDMNPQSYLRRTRDKLERDLRRHVETVVAGLESNPEVERVPYMDARARAALREAARWQLLGERPLNSDAETVCDQLKRIGLVPRRGL